MVAIFRILVAALLLLSTAAFAAAGDWKVVRATEQVKYTVDRTNWLELRAGDVVPNRAWVSTGPRGRVQLARGVESITFQPNTLASITGYGGFLSPQTQIVQQVGSLELEIEKRSQPHTTVQTPYLAAVVKGTIFHVTVDKTKASVFVDRGLVQVTSFASGQQSNLGPRQSATVDSMAGMTVRGQATKPGITSVAPSLAKIPPVGTTKIAGAVEASEAENKSSAAGKDKGSSASSDGNSANGKGNGSSSNGNGNSGGNGKSGGNGNGNSGKSDNNSGGSGNGNSGGNGSGNSGGNDNSGKGDNNSGGNGNGKGKNK
ncbi:hypothetical protein G9X68_09480 [Rhizobium sp. WYCCWR 11279]|uniref:hypothetical protein n=1 Tax=Rhizobium TaxID=379 RepID=UPI001491AF87|nr:MULTISPECIES: hypothetical protein [Rhizobium]MCH4547077.1 hypothetical protein [Rhizobium changzhiense]MCV9943184.1 hypothetical protein [Rhizobium sp. BT-175]MCW0014826.1 hypothetical protein [Rhizobium sp. BT-226]NNU47347.1 hypothetical protein [Rhizobium changzhiense]